ncbi:lyase family protein [Georgenia deserti]|uniref:Lyase family protein n=1 Tax=Georgenia deserti TaxID=2093781 RepID=A0ABW4L2X1_9MICO
MTLLGALFGDPAVDELLEDDGLVASMVETEIALLRALERRGIIPHGVADRADAAFAEHRFDPDALAAASTGGGNPVVPLVKAMLSVAPEDVRPWLHHGATSQDVWDTAVMLRSARVIDVVVSALGAARDAAAVLADRHRSTRQIARTLGQHAVPTTFGVVAAGWAVGLDAARRDLLRVRADLAVQLAGAGGTLGVYGAAGRTVVEHLAEELGLAVPAAPWHTDRTRVRSLAAATAGVVAAAGKVATDVVVLSASDVAEVAEGGGADHGGSSAMPHKRNPVTSVLVRGAAMRAPGLLSTIYSASLQENQRATGGWHAEWQPLFDLLSLAGGAATRIGDVLAGLQVETERMNENLDHARPAVMAEQLTTVLKSAVGRAEAQRVVADAMAVAREGVAARERSATPANLAAPAGAAQAVDEAVVDAVVEAGARSDVSRGVDRAELRRALDPESSLEACSALVDSALQDVTRPDVAL